MRACLHELPHHPDIRASWLGELVGSQWMREVWTTLIPPARCLLGAAQCAEFGKQGANFTTRAPGSFRIAVNVAVLTTAATTRSGERGHGEPVNAYA
jgi:hypothetical protein